MNTGPETDPVLERVPLGRTGFSVSRLGFGAFKIGRNVATKYPCAYDLPSEAEAERLLNGILDLGINLIDTAPAYGRSEELIGRFLTHRRAEFVLSTKVGETFEDGKSRFDFSAAGVRTSVELSLRRLRTDALDLVFVHSSGLDLHVMHETEVVPTLRRLKEGGLVRAIGFSAKSARSCCAALEWADAIMVEYHVQNRTSESDMADAVRAGVAVIVKKGLGSGHLPPDEALRAVLANIHVTSMLVGSLNLQHMRHNAEIASKIRRLLPVACCCRATAA